MLYILNFLSLLGLGIQTESKDTVQKTETDIPEIRYRVVEQVWGLINGSIFQFCLWILDAGTQTTQIFRVLSEVSLHWENINIPLIFPKSISSIFILLSSGQQKKVDFSIVLLLNIKIKKKSEVPIPIEDYTFTVCKE